MDEIECAKMYGRRAGELSDENARLKKDFNECEKLRREAKAENARLKELLEQLKCCGSCRWWESYKPENVPHVRWDCGNEKSKWYGENTFPEQKCDFFEARGERRNR